MDENAELAAGIREWMLAVMRDRGIEVTEWAKLAKVARTTIARPIKPGYAFVTSSRTLSKLAKAAGVAAPDGADCRLVDPDGELLAVARVDAGAGLAKPRIVLAGD
jgi:5,10-methylenetetrahydrofolate reductase